MNDRESVRCPFCGAEPGQACAFWTDSGKPWMVLEDGVERRVVHAARYALTLPSNDRQEFWETAVEKYLATELAALGEEQP